MNLHKILANMVVFAGFAAIPFIPFIILSESTFFPFIVGKNFAFRVVVEIMFSAWVILAVIDPAYRPKKSYLLGAFAAFLLVITISAFLGENPAKSFWSNFERMEGLVTYFHLFAYFVIASVVLTERGLWNQYLNLHLFAGAIMAVYGVMQWAGAIKVVQDGLRINGTLGNAEYLGTYALFNVFIAGFLIVRQSFSTTGGKIRMVIYGTLILLQTFVLYHTGTRGAILGLLAGFVLTALLVAFFEKNNKTARRSAIAILIAMIIFVGGFIAFRDASFVQESPVLSRLAAISPSEGTGKSRLMIWAMAYEGFKERPILGWGMENFISVFNKYYDPNMYGQEQWFDRAHNVFFDWLIAGGMLTLLAYVSLFILAIYCIWRRAEELSVLEKSVLTGLLGGYFFQNLFVFDNITSLIYFGTILAYVEGVSQMRVAAKTKTEGIKTKGGEDVTFIVSGGALILAVVLVYSLNYKGYMQNTTLIRAMSERSVEGPSHNLALFKQTLAYNSFGTSEVREQLGQLSMNGFGSSNTLSEIQKQFISLSGDELEKQAGELPRDARAQLFAGSFLVRMGMPQKGLPYLQKAAELSPRKQTILFELGNAYYNLKDNVKAEEVFKRAYELMPQYGDAEKYYLQILLVNNKRSEAEKILKANPIPGLKL